MKTVIAWVIFATTLSVLLGSFIYYLVQDPGLARFVALIATVTVCTIAFVWALMTLMLRYLK